MDSELVVWLVVGIAVGIGALIKAHREKKERDERLRRLGDRDPREGGTTARPPERSGTGPSTTSPLEEVRRFFEEVQRKGREQREQRKEQKPMPSDKRAPEPEDRRKPLPSQRPEVVTPKATMPVQRPRRVRRVAKPRVLPVVEEVVEVETPRVAFVAETPAAAMPAHPATRTPPTLARLLASKRSDLAKAVLLTEILVKPVAFRRSSPVPRFRV
ncbi:MAG TPA: hypothetical protein VMY39_01480 [Planctomycetota bacterium]|nr:hypothetical protein [Planctomycetota bacterium]